MCQVITLLPSPAQASEHIRQRVWLPFGGRLQFGAMGITFEIDRDVVTEEATPMICVSAPEGSGRFPIRALLLDHADQVFVIPRAIAHPAPGAMPDALLIELRARVIGALPVAI